MFCKKCGGDNLITKHIQKGSIIHSSSFKKIDDEYVQAREYSYYFKLKAKKEHLEKSCRNCDYTWREDTKDSLDKAL